MKDYLPDFLKKIQTSRDNAAKERLEGEERLRRWREKYTAWHSFSNKSSNYGEIVGRLAKLLTVGDISSASAEIAAEERVSLERFCQLAVTIPKEGITREQLSGLGFSVYSELGNLYIVKYPEGWTLTPKNPDISDVASLRWATVQDAEGQDRLTVFWADSIASGKYLTAHTSEVKPEKTKEGS